MLTKTRQILKLASTARRATEPESPFAHTFLTDADEGERVRTGLSITDEDWRELGCPNIITVTIEPGDLLN